MTPNLPKMNDWGSIIKILGKFFPKMQNQQLTLVFVFYYFLLFKHNIVAQRPNNMWLQ